MLQLIPNLRVHDGSIERVELGESGRIVFRRLDGSRVQLVFPVVIDCGAIGYRKNAVVASAEAFDLEQMPAPTEAWETLVGRDYRPDEAERTTRAKAGRWLVRISTSFGGELAIHCSSFEIEPVTAATRGGENESRWLVPLLEKIRTRPAMFTGSTEFQSLTTFLAAFSNGWDALDPERGGAAEWRFFYRFVRRLRPGRSLKWTGWVSPFIEEAKARGRSDVMSFFFETFFQFVEEEKISSSPNFVMRGGDFYNGEDEEP